MNGQVPAVVDGDVLVYRLFDVADAVDLVRAEEVVSAPKSRLRLAGAQSASALEFPRPPLHVALGQRALPLASGPRQVEASAHVYDYGVVSVRYKLRIAPGTALSELVPLAEELFVEPAPALDTEARREVEAIARDLGPALERPHSWEGLESYQVFLVRAFEGGPFRALDLLARAPVPELLLGETSETPLSAAERQDVLSHHFSYLEDDLAVVHWNSAFVSEPSGVEDIPDLLEFATAHLLELRYYDALLDRALHRIYDDIETGGTPLANIFTRKYRKLQRSTAALLLEISEMIERLENAVKIVGDFYLARLYQAAVRRFRLPAWQETVLRKQRLVAEVNDLIGDSADTSRAELMELAVIALIAFEIVAALK
ncbi:RMD1 family protein [Anaeromyxobacter oryzae]|uniref:DUF155 domain-containing protein n=1 Tax=Anaeromyxobacter oryzae TaxID=2918170 RepID=A0ABN6MQP9_9BACT|nr:hypothetical protein [Anaeromyxobacter oryzae]BDG03327.1 hypothetical protein AMOR_23230 [Anaeromyxobacter oryzae]